MDIYKILNELNDIFKFDLITINNEKELDLCIKDLDSYLIIHRQDELKDRNQLFLDNLPIKLYKLIEKINLFILKNNFVAKSNIKIGKYLLDTNSREIIFDNKNTKLTEQEVKILKYLKKSKNPVKVNQLQMDIWGYGKDLETHTVETHIHRLRKKFMNTFNDNELIISSKEGYFVKRIY